jgi:hypothetical protein
MGSGGHRPRREYVAPDAGAVIVRNGRGWGVDNDTWVGIMRDLADQLVDRS